MEFLATYRGRAERAELDRDRISAERAWWSRLVRRVAFLTARPEKAEDYVHAAYLKLQKYQRENKVENREAFIVRAAANLAIDERRHEQVRKETGDSIYDLVNLVDLEPLQDEVLEARTRLERVNEGLMQLNPRTRAIFVMHRIDGLKYREIAAELNISSSAVEKHIAKAALFLAEWTEGW